MVRKSFPEIVLSIDWGGMWMRVQCPHCARRMFDILRLGDAAISIKCTVCGQVMVCELDSPGGRITKAHISKRNEIREVIVTEQRALK
jgi:ribosomal protein S27E